MDRIIIKKPFEIGKNVIKSLPVKVYGINSVNLKKIVLKANPKEVEELNLDNENITKKDQKEVEELNLDNDLYEIDSKGRVNLKKNNPELEEKMDLLIKKCKEAGIDIKVTESVRSVSRQNEIYSQGRTKNGNSVTNANGSTYDSFHQWGIAFDVCINNKENAYDEEKLKKVGEIGKAIGLKWGGDWINFKDTPHFQLPGYDTTAELKEKYGNPANYANTWKK